MGGETDGDSSTKLTSGTSGDTLINTNMTQDHLLI